MHLSDTMPTLLLANTIGRLHNTLNINGLGEGIALQIIHSTYFDFAQYRLVQNPYSCFRKASCGIVVSVCTQN